MSISNNIAIYGNGLFQSEYAGPVSVDEQLRQMSESRFNRVILWSLHVQENGDFHYNDSPAVQNGEMVYDPDPAKGLNPDLPGILTQLMDAGHGYSQVLFSLGDNSPVDFEHVKANFDQVMVNFETLCSALKISAIDFDYEGGDDWDLIAKLTVALDGLGVGVTYCPYTDQESWLGCLAQVQKQLGRQPVRWLNLQCYAGGQENDPAEWVTAIANAAPSLGITDPGAFVVPGYWAKNDHDESSCPADIESTLAGLRSSGISGAFVWDTSDLFTSEAAGLCPNQDVTPKGYSDAIALGVGAVSITEFEVSPLSVEAGQPVTITWATENAVEVKVGDFGAVDPSGTRVDNPTKSTEYSVIADGDTGEDDEALTVWVTASE